MSRCLLNSKCPRLPVSVPNVRGCLCPSQTSEAACVRPKRPRLPVSVPNIRGCLCPSQMSEAACVRPKCPRLPVSVPNVRGCLCPSQTSEAACVRSKRPRLPVSVPNVRGCLCPSFHLSPDFHGNRSKISNSVCAKTLSDRPGVRVPNFVKIGPETAEEIGDKGVKCPRLPVYLKEEFLRI